MIIYPAIDVKEGKCVRLLKGDFDKVTVYSDNPVDMAKRWQEEGAEYLHLVNLDGARDGVIANIDIFEKIVNAIQIPVEFGGGVRNRQTVDQLLSIGISRIILGTAAINDMDLLKELLDKYKESIAVGIDEKDGFVCTHAWENTSNKNAGKFVKEIDQMGVKNIIYTDIHTDGMLSGPNLQSMKVARGNTSAHLIASGGVSKLEDVKALKAIGVDGVIIGKALYTNNIDLKEAIREGKE